MNKILIAIVIVVVLGGGAWLLLNSDSTNGNSNKQVSNSAMKATNTNSPSNENSDIMVDSNTNVVQPTNVSSNVNVSVPSTGVYTAYSSSAFNAASDQKRIYFFHAAWCPTCKIANTDFEQNGDSIPAGVTIFKTDYDTQDELKNRYGVTYQHTFVQVDTNDNLVTKWNGGGVDQLESKVK